MKKLIILATVVSALSMNAFASDACRSAALNAAESYYGNDPKETHVKTITEGQEYRVAVGIGNEEDGECDYDVIFPNGCDSKPTLSRTHN